MVKYERNIGLAYLVLTVAIFSTFEIASKQLSPYMAPTQITFLRFLIGGLLLLPFALMRISKKKIRLTRYDFAKFALLGFVNIVVSMGLIQLGLVYSNASVCAVLFSINPLFVMVFARFILKERMTAPKLGGLTLGVAGIVILFLDSMARKTATLTGLVLILAAAICFALYTVLGKKLITREVDSLIVTAFSFLIGSVCMIPLQIGIGVPLFPDVSAVIPQLLYMSIVVTGLAYVTYFEGLSRLEAGAGSMVYFAKPALASLLAIAVLGESVGVRLVFVIVLVAAGIFVAQLKPAHGEKCQELTGKKR